MLLRISAALAVFVSLTASCSAQNFYSAGGSWGGPRWGWGYGASRYWGPAGYNYGPAGYTYGPRAAGYYYGGPAAYTAGAYSYAGPSAYGYAGGAGPFQFRTGCVGAYSYGCAGASGYTAPASTEAVKVTANVTSPYEDALAKLESKYKPQTTASVATGVEVIVNGQRIEPKDGKITIEIKTGGPVGGPSGPAGPGSEGLAKTFADEVKAAGNKEQGLEALRVLSGEFRVLIQDPRHRTANALRQAFPATLTTIARSTRPIPNTAKAFGDLLIQALPAGDPQLTQEQRAALLAKLDELVAALKDAVK